MPIIKVTQDQINRTKQPDAGWHLMRIEKFTESDSSDKKSKNWSHDCVIIDTPGDKKNIGRYGYTRFNSKAPGFTIPFAAAVLGMPLDQLAGEEYDIADFIGKEFYGNIRDDVYEGKIQKRLEEFAPASEPPF